MTENGNNLDFEASTQQLKEHVDELTNKRGRKRKRRQNQKTHYRKNPRVVYVRKHPDIDKVLEALRESPEEKFARLVERAIRIAGKYLGLIKEKDIDKDASGGLQKFLH